MRTSLQDSGRTERNLQGSLQRRRRVARAARIRGGVATRPDREEAVLSRLSRRAGAVVRNARMRLSLRLLPELGDVASAARSDGPRSADGCRTARHHPPREETWRACHHVDVQRAADHLGMGGRDFQGSEERRSRLFVCFERKRNSGSARLHRSIRRSLQGRSQRIRRPALS